VCWLVPWMDDRKGCEPVKTCATYDRNSLPERWRNRTTRNLRKQVQLVHLNRFHTGQGHCGACKKKWKLTDSDQCSCGETQMMLHIVKSRPLTRLHGGLSKLHSTDDDVVAWLTSYGSQMHTQQQPGCQNGGAK